MAKRAAVVVCVAMLLAVAAPPPTGLASGPVPDVADSIAFTAQSGNSDVHLYDLGTRVATNLTPHPAVDHSPTWSPGGSRIAFYSNRDGHVALYVLGPGGVVTIAPAANLDWAWSPDGRAIAWVSHSDVKDLWVTDVVTGASSNLTNGTMEVWGPTWSPDSALIAFETLGEGGFKDIFVMPRGGGPAVNLTGGSPGNDLNPAWSPDGKEIAFVSQRDGTSAIYVMNPDGSNPKLLIGAPKVEACGNVSLGSLAWSPDGSRLAYGAHLVCGMPVTQGVQFHVVDRATGTTAVLAAGRAFRASGPMWSSDSKKLAVVTGGWSRKGVTIVGADGSNPVTLTTHLGGQSCTDAPSWSPDGLRLAFAVRGSCVPMQESPPEIYVVDADGGSPALLTAGAEPAWRPQAVNVGLVDPTTGVWHLRGLQPFDYGNPGDIPFVGDWDCDGEDTPGLFRPSDAFAYLRNTNTTGIADTRFFFGNPDDVPLAGDFNGDGCDTLSVYRPSEQRFYIVNDLGENGASLGAADYFFTFGNPGDQPVVGDWDGDGTDEVGLHRESSGLFYYRNTLDTGFADGEFFFGDPGDRFIAGDWGVVDRKESPAVFRPPNATFYFRHTNTPGVADTQLSFGRSSWLPVAGQFEPG
jgi:Tol biopolymer transport system component